jgi:hypothetical protein
MHPIAPGFVGLLMLIPGIDEQPPRHTELWRDVVRETRRMFGGRPRELLVANLRALADDIEGGNHGN